MLNIATKNLIELTELMHILGYSDMRTIKKWCIKNKIPLFKVGAKKYTLSNFLNLIIGHQVTDFVKANHENPRELLNTFNREINPENESKEKLEPNNVIELSTITNTNQIIPIKSIEIKPIIKVENTSTGSVAKINKHSTATQKFLNTIKLI